MKIKSINQLSVVLTKLEGKKSQIKHGDMKEAVSKLSDLIYKDAVWLGIQKRSNLFESKLVKLLFKNGEKRSINKSKKK